MNQQAPVLSRSRKQFAVFPRDDVFACPAGLLVGLAFAVLYLFTLDRAGFWLDEVSMPEGLPRPG
jgi:hypothetical protein